MSASVSWHIERRARVACYVYEDRSPILDLTDGGEFSLSITSTKGAVNREHMEFARALAVAAQQYAEECTRWTEQAGDEPAREPSSAA